MYDEQAAYVDKISKTEKTGKSVAVFYITSKGKLYVRNADDYVAQMVELAGGKYIFDDLNVGKTGQLFSYLFTLSELCKLFVCCISTGKCIYFMLYWMLFSNLFDIFAPDFNLNVITI